MFDWVLKTFLNGVNLFSGGDHIIASESMNVYPDNQPPIISIKFVEPYLVSGIRFDERYSFRKFTLAYNVNQKSIPYKDNILAANKTVSTITFKSTQRYIVIIIINLRL